PVMITTDVQGFQVYPDKPELKSSSDGETVFGTRIEKAAYIPTQAGNFILPAVRVSWWNTQTNTMETVTLPSKTITVLSAAGKTAASTPSAVVPTTTQLLSQQTDAKKTLTTQSLLDALKNINAWFWVAMTFATAWLVTLVILLIYWKNKRNKRNHESSITVESVKAISLKDAKSRIEQAVKMQDPQQFSLALIHYAQQCWPETRILSLTDIQEKCISPIAKDAIAALDQLRYSHSSRGWHAAETWKVIAPEFSVKKYLSKPDKNQLPSFYPETE
ncbi:MAG: hypothetical protein K2Q14_00090, partial [Gammaproteobacteria bacterium]|nr:hypothetical protein [Gammaproteobacteria bacterium]